MTKESVGLFLAVVALILQPLFLLYFLLYNTYTLALIAVVGPAGAPAGRGSLRRGPRPDRQPRLHQAHHHGGAGLQRRGHHRGYGDQPDPRGLSPLRDRGGERRVHRPDTGGHAPGVPAPADRPGLPRRHRHRAGAGHLRGDHSAPPHGDEGGGDRQGECRQGGRPERGDQRLHRAVFRVTRRRFHPGSAGPEGADAGDPGGSPGGRGRRTGGHRQRLRHPQRSGGERRPAQQSAGPVPDGRVPALLHHRADRARPARFDPHPLRASSRSSRRRR